MVLLALGDKPSAASDGQPAGHNTDGFDCSTQNLVIEDRFVMPPKPPNTPCVAEQTSFI